MAASEEDATDYETETEEVTPGTFDSFLPSPLGKIATHPAGFILGTVLSPLLGGLERVVGLILNLVLFPFVGGCISANSPLPDFGPQTCQSATDGMFGAADIPLVIGGAVGDGFALVGGNVEQGTGILGAVDLVLTTATDVASAAGPAAPIALAIIVSAVAIGTAFLVRRAALLIPGIGG